jgi:hypothetical protein
MPDFIVSTTPCRAAKRPPHGRKDRCRPDPMEGNRAPDPGISREFGEHGKRGVNDLPAG